MGVWWIVGAAVAALAVIIGLAAWWYLPEREDWDDDRGDLELRPLPPQDDGDSLARASRADPDPDLPGMLVEPVDGDAYAAELRSIGQAARADPWHYTSLAPMPKHWQVRGYTPEDWLRCNLDHEPYMAIIEGKNWLRDLARADRERETRRRVRLAA